MEDSTELYNNNSTILNIEENSYNSHNESTENEINFGSQTTNEDNQPINPLVVVTKETGEIISDLQTGEGTSNLKNDFSLKSMDIAGIYTGNNEY